MLFSDRSLWTMVHGIVLGGAALMALSAALFSMLAARTTVRTGLVADDQPRALGALTTFIAVILWLTVLTGTYVVFPAYRATPPAGVTDLSAYPRALVLANPDTAWLHAFAMESKEHVPWIAAMLATAVAFVSVRYRSRVRSDGRMRKLAVTLLAICMALVIFIGLMGVFVNKVAPLE